MPGRARPPSSRSSACASTVLPAPVSPVRTLRPGARRSSARSISRRFSTRSSDSIEPEDVSGARRTARDVAESLREQAELLAKAAIEGAAWDLGQLRGLAQEARGDRLAGRQLA